MITPPTSSSANARHEPARSLVNTPDWSPNDESLTLAMASSRSWNGKATTSGANASLEQTWAVGGTSVRIVGGKKLPSARPAQEQRATEGDGLVDPALGPAGRGAVDHRAEIRRGIEWIAQLQVGGAGHEAVHERVPDVLVDEHALDADAHLTGVGEGPDEAALDRPVEIGALVDDHAGVATELEHDLLAPGALLHPPPDRGRTGEGQQLEARVRDHPVAELAGHRQDRDRAGGHAGGFDDLGRRRAS